MTLALDGSFAWIPCKEQSRVVRVDPAHGRVTKSVRLGGPTIAVRSGFGSVWALDAAGMLYRLGPKVARIQRRIPLPVAGAYDIWIGGGSVLVADDQGARVVRVSPRTNRVVARIVVGDGPASMTFDGAVGWIFDQRDTTLFRVDLATNRSTRLTTLGGDAPKRMAWSHGSLWITGRGTDLLKVSPLDGSIQRTIEI